MNSWPKFPTRKLGKRNARVVQSQWMVGRETQPGNPKVPWITYLAFTANAVTCLAQELTWWPIKLCQSALLSAWARSFFWPFCVRVAENPRRFVAKHFPQTSHWIDVWNVGVAQGSSLSAPQLKYARWHIESLVYLQIIWQLGWHEWRRNWAICISEGHYTKMRSKFLLRVFIYVTYS